MYESYVSPEHSLILVYSLALVSIIMGFAFNTAFHTPVPVPTGTVRNPSGDTWGVFSANQVNRSIAMPVAGTTALSTSSLKDLSLSVLTPGVTSLSVNPPQVNSLSLTSRVNSLSISTHPTSLSLVHTPPTSLAVAGPSHQSVAASSGPQASFSKDVLIRGVTPTSLSEVHPEAPSLTATRTHKKQSRPDGTSLDPVSLRFVDGLSEAIDVGAKIFSKAIKGESGAKDLVDAMDDFLNVIHTQTRKVVNQSKGKARAFGEEVVSRNDKARGRAKELKKKGEEFLNSASVQFFERTENARQRAKGLKESFRQTEAWKSYEKVHADWVSRLKATEQCTKDKPGWMARDSWAPVGVHQVSSPPLRGR